MVPVTPHRAMTPSFHTRPWQLFTMAIPFAD